MNSRLAVTIIAVLTIGCSPAATTTPPSISSTTDGQPTESGNPDNGEAAVASPEEAPGSATSEPVAARSSSNEIERITFDDLNCGIQANIMFRDWMLTPRAKELDGKRVRLAGYMLPDGQLEDIEEFVLLKNTECKFGPDGQADHLAMIKFENGEATDFTKQPIDVIGTLRFKPWNEGGFTWAIYEIEAEKTQPMQR